MQLKSRVLALPLAAVLASGAFFHAAPAQAAPKSKTYKAGAIALGALGAYMLSKGKTVEGAAILGGGYLAYRQGEKERKREQNAGRFGGIDNGYYNNGNPNNGSYNNGNTGWDTGWDNGNPRYNNNGGYYSNGSYNNSGYNNGSYNNGDYVDQGRQCPDDEQDYRSNGQGRASYRANAKQRGNGWGRNR